MIERLLDEEIQYGEPEYSQVAKKITELREQLEKNLDADGRKLLEEISDAYIYQGNFLIRDAFEEGFCAAIEIVFEVIQHQRD